MVRIGTIRVMIINKLITAPNINNGIRPNNLIRGPKTRLNRKKGKTKRSGTMVKGRPKEPADGISDAKGCHHKADLADAQATGNVSL